jgi:oligopeptide transport system substrate-binding protein
MKLFKDKRWWQLTLLGLLVIGLLILSGCFPENKGETYYGQVVVPKVQEFRWSNGGLPKIFDPALAVAPPDTDAVRALFEGLTDYNRKSLEPMPGVAERWESDKDHRQWTFYLRKDAKWSNGDPVVAKDFLRSWQRTLELKDRAPHANLMSGIKGVKLKEETVDTQNIGALPTPSPTPTSAEEPFGVETVGDHILRVHLQRSIKNFPSLVSHPVFRPIHETGTTSNQPMNGQASENIVTNGAFRLTKVDQNNVVLERAGNYWDAKTVKLDKVRFVATKDAETALVSYRVGEIDAVTNSALEPLGLKLLIPYKDFRREIYAALTYYIFNPAHPLLKDTRIRKALALSIDRKRLSEDVTDGITEPTTDFIPNQLEANANSHTNASLDYDPTYARNLLAEAGYPLGEGFPHLRLLINRNDQHKAVAQAIANMWKTNLGINTEIILKTWDEYEGALQSGNYDIARRSIVMQTVDESTNMISMFGHLSTENPANPKPSETPTQPTPDKSSDNKQQEKLSNTQQPFILTEEEAFKELPAIPLYFASSYALVKPYVEGFETNLLDAPSLKHVSINTKWEQKN